MLPGLDEHRYLYMAGITLDSHDHAIEFVIGGAYFPSLGLCLVDNLFCLGTCLHLREHIEFEYSKVIIIASANCRYSLVIGSHERG